MAITKIQTGGIPALAVTHDKLHTTMDLSGKTVTLPTLTALDVTNNIVVGGTVDGIDIAARDAVLTSTATTASAALPLAGGTMTGTVSAPLVAVSTSVAKMAEFNSTHTNHGYIVLKEDGADKFYLGASTAVSGQTGHYTVYTSSGIGLDFNTGGAGSPRMRIDSSGKVLIGTTTEGQGQADNFTVSDSGNMGMTLRSTDSGECSIFFSDATSGTGEYAGSVQYVHSNDSMVFATGGVAHMRISSLGYVGIGTEAPAERLEIKTASPALKLTDTGNSNNNVKISQGYNSYLTASNDVYMSAGGYSNLFSMINGVIQVKKTTTGNISSGGARQGSVIKLLHSGQWEAGYNSTPTDFLGAVEFSSDDTSGSGLAGAGVRAAIRAPIRDAYNNVGLSFETGGTRAERMLIDYNGRVTMPNQPAFRAIYSGSAISLTNTYFPFNTVSGSYNSFDIGSNFRTSASPSSGTNAHSYTAPVAGRYYFVVSTICNTTNNNGAWYLRRNGAAVVEQHTTQTSSGWTAITMNGIINCAAGDYVNVWIGGTTLNLYGVAWGHFSGYLIG